MLSETFPDQNRLLLLSYVIFWLAIELIFRFFYAKFTGDEYQTIIVAHKKESVIHFVLMKSVISIYIFPFIDDYPFGILIRKLWDNKYIIYVGYVSFSIDCQLC
jgi:hypothetical protein